MELTNQDIAGNAEAEGDEVRHISELTPEERKKQREIKKTNLLRQKKFYENQIKKLLAKGKEKADK